MFSLSVRVSNRVYKLVPNFIAAWTMFTFIAQKSNSAVLTCVPTDNNLHLNTLIRMPSAEPSARDPTVLQASAAAASPTNPVLYDRLSNMWSYRTCRDMLSGKTIATIKELYSTVALQRCSVSTVQHAFKHKNSTVDDAEVEKHSKMSEDWWSRNGPMKALHSMNEIRIPFIRDGILAKSTIKSPTPLRGQKILDVGCGGGILSEPLARLGAQVTGVDASPELIQLAKSHAKLDPKLAENNLTYIYTTIEEHATKSKEQYNAVVASEIIEHVADKDLFVKSCLDTLKPGGSIFFTTPNRTQLGWLGGIIIAENVLRIVPKGTHEWDKFTTPTELSFILERHDCRVQAVYGAFYSFISNKWQFTSFKDFLFFLHAVKN